MPNFVISLDGVLQSGKEVTFTISPPFRKTITAVELVLNADPIGCHIGAPPSYEISNFSTASDKGSISFEIPSSVPPEEVFYIVTITLDRREIESDTPFPLIENFLFLQKQKLNFQFTI